MGSWLRCRCNVWRGGRGLAARLPGCCDGALPWCKGFCLGLRDRSVFGPGQVAWQSGRRVQLRRHLAQPGGQLGRQQVAVAVGGNRHATAPERGDDVAIVGADLGAIAAVDGASRAQAGESLRGARAGAAAAVHAAAELASD